MKFTYIFAMLENMYVTDYGMNSDVLVTMAGNELKFTLYYFTHFYNKFILKNTV